MVNVNINIKLLIYIDVHQVALTMESEDKMPWCRHSGQTENLVFFFMPASAVHTKGKLGLFLKIDSGPLRSESNFKNQGCLRVEKLEQIDELIDITTDLYEMC